MMSGRIILDNNAINRYCFANVELKSDWNGNIKPAKCQDKKKIDGVIAIIEALGGYLSTPW